MRTHLPVGLFFAGFVGALGLVGCGSEVVSTDEDPQSTLAEESAYTSGVGAKLGGDYVSKSGIYPTLSLNAKAQSYTWDTGIRCITTPCPSGEAGTWTLYKGLRGRYYAHLLSSAQQSRWFRVGLNKAGAVTELDGVFGETASFVPRIKTDPCTAVRCAAGTTCQANGNTASCVPGAGPQRAPLSAL